MAKSTKPCRRCGEPKRSGRGVAYCDVCAANGGVQRGQQLRHKYGITADKYDGMLAEQGGRCAVCGQTDPSGNALAVDHDHACCPGVKSCGKCVRGLLCRHCNTALGLLRDDPKVVASAFNYLSDFSPTDG